MSRNLRWGGYEIRLLVEVLICVVDFFDEPDHLDSQEIGRAPPDKIEENLDEAHLVIFLELMDQHQCMVLSVRLSSLGQAFQDQIRPSLDRLESIGQQLECC